jgi:hypothetical protein
VIGQYGLYSARSGSKPISPIPISIPVRQMLSFVTLNDICFISYSDYYYYSQHFLLEIERLFNISVIELISHKRIK